MSKRSKPCRPRPKAKRWKSCHGACCHLSRSRVQPDAKAWAT